MGEKSLIRPPIKYHGGKYYLCRWILSNFIEHNTYVEPYGGAASVLLNKKPCKVEVYNDIEYSVFNLMRVIRDKLDDLIGIGQKIDYTKENYLHHREVYLSDQFQNLDCIQQAIITLVVRRMSRGGLCGTFSRSDRILKNGVNAEVNAWRTTFKDVLPRVSRRLQNVLLSNVDAVEVVEEFDGPETLHYLDPPYLKKTRVFQQAYLNEMTDQQHLRLSKVANLFRGKALLSGYPSQDYADMYHDWSVLTHQIPNHSSHERTKELKSECLWRNFSA